MMKYLLCGGFLAALGAYSMQSPPSATCLSEGCQGGACPISALFGKSEPEPAIPTTAVTASPCSCTDCPNDYNCGDECVCPGSEAAKTASAKACEYCDEPCEACKTESES